jgi:hypothetical protein
MHEVTSASAIGVSTAVLQRRCRHHDGEKRSLRAVVVTATARTSSDWAWAPKAASLAALSLRIAGH